LPLLRYAAAIIYDVCRAAAFLPRRFAVAPDAIFTYCFSPMLPCFAERHGDGMPWRDAALWWFTLDAFDTHLSPCHLRLPMTFIVGVSDTLIDDCRRFSLFFFFIFYLRHFFILCTIPYQ